ncbi:SRPBCC domain-containing protein [Paraflavitalea soli]|uniref:SRPBCC domain-containing protein n=1 Tax=Paraflavitalea soli TaxID=2315862 RepID=A0A3B7MSN5_9BACT|nr:SRPBCC domain-containing protein [Paraflavitalea soli]AXY73531.1 SRPBCC domain-containing protein [Paraflavitalea soli]
MIANKEPKVTKDLANKKITFVREFDAPLEQVWHAWTEASLLDLWWAPRPWKAITKTMDFSEGGHWLYNMMGPDGTGQFCRVDFKKIVPYKSFATVDSFCSEDGKVNESFPQTDWNIEFIATSEGTTVKIDLTFASEADLQKILEMGFEQGFAMGLSNLDELLAE